MRSLGLSLLVVPSLAALPKRHRPERLMLCPGVTDRLRGAWPAVMRENVIAMLDIAHEA